jgi:hypothetical protein
MADTTPESDRILREAKTSLAVQREGGTHRPGPRSIGKGSAQLKAKALLQRTMLFGAVLLAILTAASVAGMVLNGIGFWGVMMTVLACVAAAAVFTQFPRTKVPQRAELTQGNPQQMVARTELWLEAQRPALPPPAQLIVDKLGLQLDALGLQLQGLDGAHPAMGEVRELVGEYIPETIDNYRKIPAHLRSEKYTGKTADERLTDSLGKLSGEVDRVTRRLAEGALDDLAIKSRYLEYRYGGAEALEDLTGAGMPDTGVPLPDFSAMPAKQDR